jgi:uncharacterized protein (DUF924 family)
MSKDIMMGWFSSTDEKDKMIATKFKDLISAVGKKKHEIWKTDRDGRLSLIILCD